jgi:hypothetical protein
MSEKFPTHTPPVEERREPVEKTLSAEIDYENGEHVRSTYTVRESIVHGETMREILSLTISTEYGSIDLFKELGIADANPVLPVRIMQKGGAYSQFFDRRGVRVGHELRVTEPNSPESLSLFLHETGHFAQYKDENFLNKSSLSDDEHKQLVKAGRAARNGFASFSHAWLDIEHVIPKISRELIRQRFRESFDRFLLNLSEVSVLFDQFYELEGERCELEASRLKENGYLPLVKGQETEREKELLREIEFLTQRVPMQEILFFITEPIRYYERDATRRALLWMSEFGTKLRVSSLRDLSDAGSRQLFDSLDTYNHGCVNNADQEEGRV